MVLRNNFGLFKASMLVSGAVFIGELSWKKVQACLEKIVKVTQNRKQIRSNLENLILKWKFKVNCNKNKKLKQAKPNLLVIKYKSKNIKKIKGK